MALNMPTVFGTTDDDLKPRWMQSGSTVINYVETGVTDELLRTVTTGKTFYVTDLIVYGPAGESITLLDGGAGGASRFNSGDVPGAWTIVFTFATPLQFNTDVWADTSAGAWDVTLLGWEE